MKPPPPYVFFSLLQEEKKRQTLIFSATMTFIHAGPQRSIKKRVVMTVDLKLDKLIKQLGLSKKPAVVDLSRKEGTAEKVVETRSGGSGRMLAGNLRVDTDMWIEKLQMMNGVERGARETLRIARKTRIC